MIVKIILINGSCQTLLSTIESLTNIPLPDENNVIYVGRSKEAFSAILRHLRGEATTYDYIEDFLIHGLSLEEEIGRIVHINVGGTIFTAREKVLKTMSYFKSSIDWNQNNATIIDASSERFFIDRTPEDFAKFLHIVESHYHNNEYDQIADESQATFFGYENNTFILAPSEPLVKPCFKTTQRHESAALLGLVSYGAQNAYTHSENVKSSIYLQQPSAKTLYAFNYDTVLMTKDKNSYNSNTFTATFPRTCDLIGNTYLCIDFEFEPTQDDVFNSVNIVKLEIGGQSFDAYSGDVMRVFANFKKYNVEIQESRVFIPMAFFFQNNPHLYIPLIALQCNTVIISVIFKPNHRVANMAVMYKAIFLDTNERRYFTTASHQRIICVTVEQAYTNIIIDSNNLKATLELDKKKFENVLQDLIIYLKPHFNTNTKEPLHKIELRYNKGATLGFEPILTRKMIPRELYGIDDNHELIYYIPMDNTCNLSRIQTVELELAFAIKGVYDVVVICQVNNVMRIVTGMATKAS